MPWLELELLKLLQEIVLKMLQMHYKLPNRVKLKLLPQERELKMLLTELKPLLEMPLKV
jgi:hypothetical protein